MKDLKGIRIRKLLMALNDWIDNMAYYDDDIEDVVYRDNEEGCYESIMEDKELHLLGSDYVKSMIHIMFTDYETFAFLSHKFKAF